MSSTPISPIDADNKPTALAAPPAFPAERIAVLVIHGMGAQRPYTTLDQFARGIIGIYGLPNVKQEVLFRHWQDMSIGNQKDWTQTLLRITPAAQDLASREKLIDVYEYYWAPVITGLVTARQSLLFLLFTALTPFQYLRENLAVIQEVSVRKGKKHTKGETADESTFILFRELARMAFIFLPFIAVTLIVLHFIAQPLIALIASWRTGPPPAASSQLPDTAKLFSHWPLTACDMLKLILAAIRYLFILMSGNFLYGEITDPKDSRSKSFDRTRTIYLCIMGILFAGLAVFPLILPWTTITAFAASLFASAKDHIWTAGILLLVFVGIAVSLLLTLTPLFDPWIAAFRRGWKTLLRGSMWIALVGSLALFFLVHLPANHYWGHRSLGELLLALPSSVLPLALLEYLALAAVLYALNLFLTTAIGGLAVYLGADALSKNSAARSQILHESTQTVLKILEPNKDLGPGRSPNQYDRVVIAAHSLGSVIALDMLNQLIVRKQSKDPVIVGTIQPNGIPITPPAPLEKITGLLTFGSPLNKVVYFFSTRTSALTTVLERILFVLHPFRLKVPPSPPANTPVSLSIPYPNPSPFHPDFNWINAWSRFDLISGPMFFYAAQQNPIVEKGVTPWEAHLSYWENPVLYAQLAALL